MTGDLIFVKPTNVTGKLVAFFSGSKYCHVGIMVNSSEIAEINLGYTFDIRPMTYTDYDIYRVTDDFDANELIDIIHDKVGMSYDVMDLLRILFKISFKATPKKVICSEIVNQCFGLLGIQLSNKKIPTPQDIIDGGKVERVI